MNYEVFYWINKNTDHPGEAIQDRYEQLSALRDKFVIRTGNQYRVYDSAESFYRDYFIFNDDDGKLYRKNPDTDLHEVIFSLPQKLKLDLDIKREDLNGFTYEKILNEILEAIDIVFEAEYDIKIDKQRDIAISEAHAPDGSYYSTHIVVTGYHVKSTEEGRYFFKKVHEYVQEAMHFCMDDVYKQIQNFRVVGSRYKGREMRIVTNHSVRDMIVRDIENTIPLPPQTDAAAALAKNAGPKFKSSFVKQIVDDFSLTDPDAENWEFVREFDNILIFRRNRPSFCDICQRQHDNDNSLMLTWQILEGDWESGVKKIRVYKKCRRYKPQFLNDIQPLIYWDIDLDSGESTGGSTRKRLDRVMAQIRANGPVVPRCEFGDLRREFSNFKYNVYTAPQLHDFELTETLVVQAAMKMGKTKALKKYLDKHFFNGLDKNPIIRFVSFRQTFSGAIQEKFPHFSLYKNIKGELRDPQLIVQVESLHRLAVTPGEADPDLLILDECESIFDQFTAGLLKSNFTVAWANFEYLLRYSKHVVCMDANISERTFNILRAARGDRETIFHKNKFENARDEIYSIVSNPFSWREKLFDVIEQDKRVVVPISSLSEAKVLASELRAKYPTKNIQLYSSETQQREKFLHFSDVDSYWSQYDILIYTPTVSAGVSFERAHFDVMFGYFLDRSCSAETCIQMMGRIRNVRDRQFYIYMDLTNSYLPSTREEIIKALYTSRAQLMKETGLEDSPPPSYKIGSGQNIVYEQDLYFTLWVENSLVRSISQLRFADVFLNLLARNGAQILLDYDVSIQPREEIKTDRAAMADSVKNAEANFIAEQPEIDEARYQEIKALIERQADVSPAEVAQCKKFKLRRTYLYQNEIDAKFVRKYDRPATKRQFMNLQRVYGKPLEVALAELQRQGRRKYEQFMQDEVSGRIQDLNYHYSYNQHYHPLNFLLLLGWDSINSELTISKNNMETALANPKIISNLSEACAVHNVWYSANVANNTENILKTINAILYKNYGIQITKDENEIYYLKQSKKFTTCPNESEQKKKPLLRATDGQTPSADPEPLGDIVYEEIEF